MTFLALFLTLEVYNSWRLGKGAPIILSLVLTVRCSLLMSVLAAEPNQTVIDDDGRVELFQQLLWQVELP